VKNDTLYSKDEEIDTKSLKDLFENKIKQIKDLFYYRLLNKNKNKRIDANEKESLTLESVKKQYEELKSKKEEFEKYEDDLLKYEDEIKDMDYCLIKSSDLTSAINCKKSSLSQRFLKYINVNLSINAINTLMFMDRESIIKIEDVISKLDRNEISIEKTYKVNEFNIKKICNLHISYEENKYEIKDIAPYNKEISSTLSEISNKYEEHHLQDKEIRDKFIKAFSDVKYELNIASPWMNNYVVNNDLINKMESLLIKEASIKIVYGIEENSYNFKSDNKNLNSDRIAQRLKEKFDIYGDKFKIKKVNSHNKLLICDESYYLETSFNLLSFAGEYDENSKDTRGEGATYSTNLEVIQDLRNRYFNF